MVNYRLIIEYHQKGNNNTQVATLCSCSRMTVWKVVNRIVDIEIPTDELLKLDNEKLKNIIFPEYMKKGDGYLIPDFKWEEFQMVKHRSSIRLCWRRYCKRAVKQNLAAYSWKVFLTSYNEYRRPKIQIDDPDDKIRTKLKHYNFLLAYCESDKVMYSVIQTEKEMWLKSLGLDESKIIDDREK